MIGATRFTQPAQGEGRSGAAPALVIGAVVSVQLGSATATTLFDQVGPAGAVLYRLLFAAILLLAIWRPVLMEAGREGLMLVIAFGVTLAGMNLSFYESLDRIDLGIAVTFEFVGPLLVGLLGSRRALDLVWVACAAIGVLLLTRPSGSASAAGIGFALLAGGFWAAYILLSARVGRAFSGGRGLALAMGVAAALMVVPGTAAAGGDLLDPGAAAVGAATAVLSSVIPYSLELEALRRIAVGTFGVLMSLEPAVAALIGLVALDQGLAAIEVLGIALVVVASAGVLGASVAQAPDRGVTRPRAEAAAAGGRSAGGRGRRPLTSRSSAARAGSRRATTACGARSGPGGRPDTSTQERICLWLNRPSSEFHKPKRVHGNPIGGRKSRK